MTHYFRNKYPNTRDELRKDHGKISFLWQEIVNSSPKISLLLHRNCQNMLVFTNKLLNKLNTFYKLRYLDSMGSFRSELH